MPDEKANNFKVQYLYGRHGGICGGHKREGGSALPGETFQRTATRDLARLVALKMFEQIGVTGKGTEYMLTRHKDAMKTPVKGGRTGKLSGLEHFRRIYPDANALLVGEGGIPLEKFFKSDAGVWFV